MALAFGRLTVLVMLAVWPGCGAKTGLDTPDSGSAPGRPGIDAAVAWRDADAGARPRVCIVAPREAGEVVATFVLPVELAIVDVFFVLDASASMADETANIRARLRSSVIPGVRESIPDTEFGLAFAGEFPVEPHGPGEVKPYQLSVPVTDDIVRIEGALDHAPTWGNYDFPEAQVEALYQVATGEGLYPWISAGVGCPRGGTGGACFRRDALPVIVLITDAPMHNGPRDVAPVDDYGFLPSPHSYVEAIRALRDLGALVIGLGADDYDSPSPMPHLRAVAHDSGAVESSREELAFDIGSSGDGVGGGVVHAIERLASGVPLDVDAVVEDLPGDAGNALDVVSAVRPVEAVPASGAARVEPDRFVGVMPGTRVTFALVVDASRLAESDIERRYMARVVFRANGRSRLGAEDVVIIVPGLGGADCSLEG